jgi:UDP-sugar transporter A1/2/3
MARFTSSHSSLIGKILTIVFEQKQGSYNYNPAALLFLSETLKFLFSLFMAWNTGQISRGFLTETLDAHLWKFSLPALIYQVQNNLVFYTLLFVSVPTYTIMNNLKILSSAVFFCFLLSKRLTYLQWVALFLLTLGCMTSQLSTSGKYFISNRIDCKTDN